MIPPRIRGGGNSPSVCRESAALADVASTTLQAPQQQNMEQQPQQLPQQAEGEFINQLAKKLMDSCTPEIRAKFQSKVNAWPDQKTQQILQKGVDPLFFRFREHAEMLYKRGKVQIPKQQGVNPMEGQQSLNIQGPIGQSKDKYAPHGDFTESSFDLSDSRAIEAQYSNSPNYRLPSVSARHSEIQDISGQFLPASNYAATNPSYVTPTMWQEAVASSFQPGVERKWDQVMVGQSTSEIPLSVSEDFNFGFDDFHNDSPSLDTTGDVPAAAAPGYIFID